MPEGVECGGRWSSAESGEQGVNVTVSWMSSANQNGITLRYFLNFTSYDGLVVFSNVTVDASTTSFTFTNVNLGKTTPTSCDLSYV